MIKKFKIKIDGKEYRVEVEGVDEEKGLEGEVREKKQPGERINNKVKEHVTKGDLLVKKDKHVVAPMPGAVVKINCRPGEMVKKGEVIIVLEAMKMENEINSPIDGLVKELKVKEGMTVSPEEVMVVFE